MTRAILLLALTAAFLAPAGLLGTAHSDDDERPVPASWMEDLETPWRESLVPEELRGKRTFRLGVVPVAFPDRAPDPRSTREELERLFFSRDTFTEASDGTAAHGSVADFYASQSYGRFTLEGLAFDWVTIETKAADLLAMPMVNTRGQYRELALAALREREGADALEGLDGLVFLGAGDAGQRGRGLWPHRGRIEDLEYLQLTERYRDDPLLRAAIPCHELGHVFGFKDKYGLRNPRQGPGPWCLMARGTHGGPPSNRTRPFSFCAWCKTQLGWLEPVTFDPRVKRSVLLGPVGETPKESVRLLVKEDGSEYFLLEVRKREGTETDLPDEGLLIWHVGERKSVEGFPVREYDVVLEPPHPKTVVDTASRYAAWTCWPKPGMRDFTPDTTPSSRSRSPGALPVSIRNITRRDDGCVTFDIGPGPTTSLPIAPAPRLEARALQALLLVEEGTEPPADARTAKRGVERFLYGQGAYFGSRRSLSGDEVHGGLADYVAEVSGGSEGIASTRALPDTAWTRVPPGSLDTPVRAIEAVLGGDLQSPLICFVARAPGAGRGRYEAGTIGSMPCLVVRCGDGSFGHLGQVAKWWLEQRIGPHVGPPQPDCLLEDGWKGGGETGTRQPFHLCALCKHRAGWLAPLDVPADALRPLALFAEARVEPDGTAVTVNRTRLGFDERLPEPGLRTFSLVDEATYPSFEVLSRRLEALASPTVTLTEAGRTLGGRALHLARIAGVGPVPPDERPAMFVIAAIHGNEASTVPAVLRFVEQTAEHPPTDRTVYVMPCVNADAYAAFVTQPHTVWRPRANLRPVDDDGDGQADEDGYSDVNGDGQIGFMRRKKDDGEWELIGREGLDDDGDGRVAEDIPGGVDLNRNFPEGWRPGRGRFGLSRGDAPLSEPESRAVAEAIRAHPNIALVVDVHNDADTLFVRLGEPTDRTTAMDALPDYGSYQPVMDAARRVFGYDTRRTARAGIMVAWAYEGLGIPGAILEIGSGARARAPATKEAAKANAWSREHFGIDGWNDWQPFDHPTLGEVEIGGDWQTFVKRSPPPGRPLGVVATRTATFLTRCLDVLPRLDLAIDRARSGATALVVSNPGGMPTATQRRGLVEPERGRHVVEIIPGSVVSTVPAPAVILVSNAAITRVAIPALAPGARVRIDLDPSSAAEGVVVRTRGGPFHGADVAWSPEDVDAGTVTQVDVPKHGSHYMLHVPGTYTPGQAAPLLVDLHGAAPVSRNPARISVAPWKATVAEGGVIHLLPQSRARAWGQKEDDDQFVLDCIADVMKAYDVDENRIWLTGFSSGADFALGFLARNPDRFAAAAPMMPGQFLYGRAGDRGLCPDTLRVLRGLPLLYVTGLDDVRRPTVREIVFTLNEIELDAHLREVPGVGHAFPPGPEYQRILAFLDGAARVGDPIPELGFPVHEVAGGHVAVEACPEKARGTLVVLPGGGVRETRPELRAYDAVRGLAEGLQVQVILPWAEKEIDAAFLKRCLKKTKAPKPWVLYGHGDAASPLATLVSEKDWGAVVASGPRSTFARSLGGLDVKVPLTVLLGERAFDREPLEAALESLAEGGALVTWQVVPGTRLFEPPPKSTLEHALEAGLSGD